MNHLNKIEMEKKTNTRKGFVFNILPWDSHLDYHSWWIHTDRAAPATNMNKFIYSKSKKVALSCSKYRSSLASNHDNTIHRSMMVTNWSIYVLFVGLWKKPGIATIITITDGSQTRSTRKCMVLKSFAKFWTFLYK